MNVLDGKGGDGLVRPPRSVRLAVHTNHWPVTWEEGGACFAQGPCDAASAMYRCHPFTRTDCLGSGGAVEHRGYHARSSRSSFRPSQ